MLYISRTWNISLVGIFTSECFGPKVQGPSKILFIITGRYIILSGAARLIISQTKLLQILRRQCCLASPSPSLAGSPLLWGSCWFWKCSSASPRKGRRTSWSRMIFQSGRDYKLWGHFGEILILAMVMTRMVFDDSMLDPVRATVGNTWRVFDKWI